MSKYTHIFVGVAVALLLTGVMFVGFWLTGGKSLALAYQNYLSKDIPDKIYSYQDFRDRGPREMLHGYYAGSDDKSLYMWTLLGLKRFYHRSANTLHFLLPTARIHPISPNQLSAKYEAYCPISRMTSITGS